jgi:uncharacterized membrane protein YfcA
MAALEIRAAARTHASREHAVGIFDPHLATSIAISAAIFAGAVVSGLMGFAFSAVAGAILLHVLPPVEAVPLMMACSIITQAISLVGLRGSVQWCGNPVLIAGGIIGMVPALYLLHHVDAKCFRIGFGAFLVVYAGWMLLRPAAARIQDAPQKMRDAIVGFGGGLVGGLTAMPGALPVIWCDLRGMPKEQQRALVQPYIAVMQVSALALLLLRHSLSREAILNLTMSLPALAAGAGIGVLMFRRVNEAVFRSAVLVVLGFAGVTLVI